VPRSLETHWNSLSRARCQGLESVSYAHAVADQ
jgi:hypothetical protein